MTRTLLALAATTLASAAPSLAAEPSRFTPLGVTCGPAFFPQFCAVDMSGDARTILFQNSLWTEGAGFTPISGPAEGFMTVALSDDGSTVVGTIGAYSDELGLHEEAAIWRGGDAWQALGGLPGTVPCGTSYTASWDVSGDGSTVVGLAWTGAICSGAHGFRWTAAEGMVDLGSIVADRSSRANAISADGTVIVGWSDSAFGSRSGASWRDGAPPRWFKADGARIFAGEAINVNSDGSVVVGGGFADAARPQSYSEPWRWTAETGVQSLGLVRGLRGGQVDGQHYATDVSDDGSVVVGQVTMFVLGEQSAWIWTSERGTAELLQDYLQRTGDAATRSMVCPGKQSSVVPCAGWKLWNIAAVSNDGTKLVGTGANPDGFFEAFLVELAK